ncbi:hypothetical protein SBV1_2430010 [Verrucomicrobia bacterium]|nr:hypothetical protein SBV1_2430010 [Verrucomicrobiota bacterium]
MRVFGAAVQVAIYERQPEAVLPIHSQPHANYTKTKTKGDYGNIRFIGKSASARNQRLVSRGEAIG